MDDIKKKLWEKIRFYYKRQQEVSFISEKMKITGIITKKSPFFLKKKITLQSLSGDEILVFIEDIDPKTLFPSSLEVVQSKDRKSIPKSLKDELWRNHFGDRFHGYCFVCKHKMDRNNWEAAHVLAAINGGPDTLDNLRPTCRTCNRSMGDMNLEEFKAKYH